MTNYSIPCMGPHLLLLRKIATKLGMMENTDEGQSEETEDQALISAIKIFSTTTVIQARLLLYV